MVFVRAGGHVSQARLRETLERNWGGTIAIVNGEEIELLDHPRLVAGDFDGVAIYRIEPKFELLVLQAMTRGAGVGSALLTSVIANGRASGRAQLFVTTTNDNLQAIEFYKRNGFQHFETREGAVDRARLLKPSLPRIGANGVPIRDEIEFVLNIEGA